MILVKYDAVIINMLRLNINYKFYIIIWFSYSLMLLLFLQSICQYYGFSVFLYRIKTFVFYWCK